MQEKSVSHSSLLSRRASGTLVFCIAACVLTAGTLLAFLRPEASTKVSQRTLTFAERVSYQRDIEEVYWRHRIWPKENPSRKPSLDAVMSQAQLEKKVEDYLRNSQALEDGYKELSADQLQAETDRMAQHTKQPDVLHELFEALGNDPFVVAECLARPILSERLVDELHAGSNLLTEAESLGSAVDRTETESSVTTEQPPSGYYLPEIASSPVEDPAAGCVDNWTATSTIGAPNARALQTAVWTGTEMIVWGGVNGANRAVNTGGRYSPSTDSWVATSTNNAPEARYFHTAVWTGTEMIVWGGGTNSSFLNTGGKYDPSTDSWVATTTTGAPFARRVHTAVWTGTEMIIWGGFSLRGDENTGRRYNPSRDRWSAMTTTGAPTRRSAQTAVWTGTEMIIWGGGTTGNVPPLNTGGKYNPSTNSWMATTITGAPTGRDRHTAVWTGTEMIVWGGTDDFNLFNDGGKYNPSTNSWVATATNNAPEARYYHTAVWTNSEVIVWGGYGSPPFDFLNTGGRYNPSTDSWVSTTTTGAPAARSEHTAVWTSSEMIVWGGYNNGNPGNSGGRYVPCAGSSVGTTTVDPTLMGGTVARSMDRVVK